MGLSLTAEQKAVIKIFKIDEQYVIPAYQRPYSWGYDQCFQLYTDLIEKFEEGEEYFLGNVIIAKSEVNKDTLQVIDGQQRLTTLLIMIKILSLMNPSMKVLEDILEQEDWEGVNKVPRLVTHVFEEDDQSSFSSILGYRLEDFKKRYSECIDTKGRLKPKKSRNIFELNSLYFYSWFSYYNDKNGNIKEFVSYLLRSAYLLPIELTGRSIEDASEKALVIFETINNRGLNLSDADIFKAKLYQKAKNVGEENKFIKQWVEFKLIADDLNIEIDDVFRYYSHIIRGKQGITASEINLREFFVRESYSPFNNLKYQTIIDQIYNVLEVIEFLSKGKYGASRLAPYLNLIDSYTNQYPRFALSSYLFKNGIIVDNKLIKFCESILRYFYIQGSTTAVKFETYNIIKNVFQDKKVSSYCKDIKLDQLSYLGLLKKGYALLAFYLDGNGQVENLTVDKIINAKDYMEVHDPSEGATDYKDLQEMLGNYIVIDLRKKFLPVDKKLEYYQTSKIDEVRTIGSNPISFSVVKERDVKMKKNIIKFFSCDDSVFVNKRI